MLKRFRFTNTVIAALPANPASSRSTESEYSDTEISGLKLLSGKSGCCCVIDRTHPSVFDCSR